jgi:hypothetical protein
MVEPDAAPLGQPAEPLEYRRQHLQAAARPMQPGIAGGGGPGQVVAHGLVDAPELGLHAPALRLLEGVRLGREDTHRGLQRMGQVAGGVAGALHQAPIPFQHAVDGAGQWRQLGGQPGIQALDLTVLDLPEAGLQPAQRRQGPAHLGRQRGQQQQGQPQQGEHQQAGEAGELRVQLLPAERHADVQRRLQGGQAEIALDQAQRHAPWPRDVTHLGARGRHHRQPLVP